MAVPDAEAILYCGQLKAEAMRRGCKFVKLETFSFQAWDFYKKNGYTVFAELDQVVGDHRWYFLKKDLKA
jgi:hypothetical protein